MDLTGSDGQVKPVQGLTLPKVFTTPVTSMAGGDQTPPTAAGVDLDAGAVAA